MKKSIVSIFLLFVLAIGIFAQSDAALAQVILKDKTSRDVNGKLLTLPAAEHLAPR